VLCGIIYSGYRAVVSFLEDHERELRLIEEEGKVYMQRIEKAKILLAEGNHELAVEEDVESDRKASGE
jgi:hypothetical protein